MLNKMCSYLYAKASTIGQYTKNEKGAQAIEYVGVAAVVVVLIIALMSLFGKESGGIASSLTDKIKEAIDKIKIGG
ncbi:hypothetical protein [Paenibacillus sp. WLX2291]|uniref:hypothetical protein n=1 Tax=Paenibacillus sp. WLX2291 TaxID=3296934 RepID=UPI0039843397